MTWSRTTLAPCFKTKIPPQIPRGADPNQALAARLCYMGDFWQSSQTWTILLQQRLLFQTDDSLIQIPRVASPLKGSFPCAWAKGKEFGYYLVIIINKGKDFGYCLDIDTVSKGVQDSEVNSTQLTPHSLADIQCAHLHAGVSTGMCAAREFLAALHQRYCGSLHQALLPKTISFALYLLRDASWEVHK